MISIDVFNGDADGICALHQLRLHAPDAEARLVTGVKRDINLLARLDDVREARITVLDISLDKNRAALEGLLARNNKVFYVDHHYCGEVPDSAALECHIDPDPLTCTSMIVDKLLKGRYRRWAIVGAFGDNLDETAVKLGAQLELSPETMEQLKETGVLLNYNGYGATPADLYYTPEELYRQIRTYEDPLEFYASSPALAALRRGYRDDMNKAQEFEPLHDGASGRVYHFPDAAWARRVSGVFANQLCREQPDKAHALLTNNADGSLRISVRAPLNNRRGADELCRQFPTGGGRAAAAGVNQLPQTQLSLFIETFSSHFSPTSDG